jgi:hypothetical protein
VAARNDDPGASSRNANAGRTSRETHACHRKSAKKPGANLCASGDCCTMPIRSLGHGVGSLLASGYKFSLVSLLGVVIGTLLFQSAFADTTCDEGHPVQRQCFCECSGLNSSSRGDGACEIAERIKIWCAVSFLGRTGSLGSASIPSRIKDTSIDLARQAFTPAAIFSRLMINIHDYRTDDYADMVNHYSFEIIPYDNIISRLVKLSIVGAKVEVPPELAMSLFLWARGGYTSLPSRTDIEESDFKTIDEAVVKDIFSDPNIFRTFFAGSNGEIYHPSDAISVSRGYLRISPTGDTSVKVIWRELLPKE